MILIRNWLMALFPQPKERRRNRPLDMPVITPSNAYYIAALAQIANMTKADMTDAEFRIRAQDLAHEALVKGKI